MKTFPMIFLTFFIASCASAPAITPEIGPLEEFFARCRSDMEKAKKVIVNHDLVKNLTHLQRMADGGDKYYLLERENITAMIRAVTVGVYFDFILINKQGAVVYSMANHAVFGKNVLTQLGKTALRDCYENRDTAIYLGTASILPADDRYTNAVSSKVSGANIMPGIFVLIIDASKIQEIIGEKASIIDSSGNYVLTGDREKINTRFIGFSEIDLSREKSWYRFLRLNGALWIIVSE